MGMARALRLFVIFAVLSLLGNGCSSDDEQPPPTPRAKTDLPRMLVHVPDCQAGRVLAPNARAELRARVTDLTGAPAKGRSVIFVAPANGASGAFTTPDPTLGPSYARAITDDDGVAIVSFTANDRPGGYLIDALVEGVNGQTTFAVTNTPTPLPDGALADKIRCRVEADPTLFDPNSTEAIVHGPLFLPAGSSVASADAPVGAPPLVASGAPLWFFWIDDHRLAMFSHGTRWVTFPATATEAPPSVTPHDWWPVMSYPDAAPTALRSPWVVNRAAIGQLQDLRPKIHFTAARPIGSGFGSTLHPLGDPPPPPKTVAIVTSGKGDEQQLVNTADQMRDFFEDTLKLPVSIKEDAAGNPTPPTLAEFGGFIDKAKADGATSIIWFTGSHGFKGGAWGYADGSHRWEEFAKLLQEKLAGTDIKMTIIVWACFSGSAIKAFDAAGFDGEIITSSDAENLSYMQAWPYYNPTSFFTEDLEDAWTSAPTLTGVVSGPKEAYDLLLQTGTYFYGTSQNPQHHFLEKNPDTFPVPAVNIPCVGDDVKIDITLPQPPAGTPPVTENESGTIYVFPETIATAGLPTLVINKGSATASKTFTGLQSGGATYVASMWMEPKGRYVGVGQVTVGACTSLVVAPISAVFVQQTFSTTYSVAITNPHSEPVTITWSVTGEPAPCVDNHMPVGTSAANPATSQTPSMTWTHPSPACDHTTQHASAVITATVQTPTRKIVCTYKGAESGAGQPCVSE